MELPQGTTLRSATYRLERVLGQGGFGITYYGQEIALQRPVAVKEHFPYGCVRQNQGVNPGILSAQEYQASLQRFAQESRLLAQFDHPSIVRVLTVFEEAHTSYLVMDYVEGPSFQQLLDRQGKMAPGQVVGYMIQACQALEIVHERGLLHRDIKPSNLLLRGAQQRLVLIDFGSAREAALKRATAIVSAGYSPPELYSEGAGFGPFTDIYALAATFYHLLVGEPPPDCLQRLLGTPVVPYEDLSIWGIIERGLSMDPQQRYATMSEFLAALGQLQGGAAGPGQTVAYESGQQIAGAPSQPLAASPGQLSASGPIQATDSNPSKSIPLSPNPPIDFHLSAAAPNRLQSKSAPPAWPPTLTGHRCWVRALAFSPDGLLLASGSEDKTVKIWSQGSQLAALTEHTGWIWGLLFSEDGSRLYSAGYDRQLICWDTASWQRLNVEKAGDQVQCLSRWGVWLALGTLSGKLELRRLPDMSLLRTVKLPGSVTACTFVAGNLAATAGDDRIYLIDIETGEILERLKGHERNVRTLATLPDGTLVSGGADKSVRFWDLGHGQSTPCTGHQGTVLGLAACGSHLVSGSGDKTVRLWDVSTHSSRELGSHNGEVTAVAATGGWVASAGQDNLVRMWST